MAIPLCAAEVLVIAGADAVTFAHAQFSSDVKALAVGHWQWSAWLDPQGRVRCFFALLRVESDRFIAWLPLGGAQPMCDALSRFVMRSALKLDTRLDWILHQLDENELDASLSTDQVVARAQGFALTQPGALPRIAWIAAGERGERRLAIKTDRAALNHWRLGDIDAGLPLLPPMLSTPPLSGEFVPQALDLERLDAIRFDKGCYPGQEIAARLHFRGGNKRHLQRLRIDGAAPEDPVSIIGDHDKVLGHVLYAANTSTTTSEAIGVLADAHSEAAQLLTSSGLDVVVIAAE